jgi:hypothetical protein
VLSYLLSSLSSLLFLGTLSYAFKSPTAPTLVSFPELFGKVVVAMLVWHFFYYCHCRENQTESDEKEGDLLGLDRGHHDVFVGSQLSQHDSTWIQLSSQIMCLLLSQWHFFAREMARSSETQSKRSRHFFHRTSKKTFFQFEIHHEDRDENGGLQLLL